MPRQVSHFVCQECGFESPKWAGQCGGCGKWNSLVETLQVKRKKMGRVSVSGVKLIKLSQVSSEEVKRIKTGIGELDRVLGEGLVPGSVILLAGEPGIGKSTLLTQLAIRLKSVLYVCGEESPSQVKLRVDRLGVKSDGLLLLAETNTDVICSQISAISSKLGLVIVDSIQSVQTQDLSGMAGSVGQIRESANRLIEVCKRAGIPLVLVGHVTKEGSIAGPKVLEHMVDVVLTLEGDKQHDFRILRGAKNRFGAIEEVGVFSMGESGMKEVKNPSGVFLNEKSKSAPGSVVVVTMAGLRPICVEIQALVVPTQLAIPRRVSTGVDQRKLVLMSAVLQKHCRLGLGNRDIFVNVVGGLRIIEPAVDLGLALAIASGFTNKVVKNNSVVIGEVGLMGEIRKVGRIEQRIKEAKKLGYLKIISPQKYSLLKQVVKGELK